MKKQQLNLSACSLCLIFYAFTAPLFNLLLFTTPKITNTCTSSDFSWSQLPLGRPLARLSCALYRDHFYMISNNASSIFRYDPATCTLEQWRELHEVNLEFAGKLIG